MVGSAVRKNRQSRASGIWRMWWQLVHHFKSGGQVSFIERQHLKLGFEAVRGLFMRRESFLRKEQPAWWV